MADIFLTERPSGTSGLEDRSLANSKALLVTDCTSGIGERMPTDFCEACFPFQGVLSLLIFPHLQKIGIERDNSC